MRFSKEAFGVGHILITSGIEILKMYSSSVFALILLQFVRQIEKLTVNMYGFNARALKGSVKEARGNIRRT